MTDVNRLLDEATPLPWACEDSTLTQGTYIVAGPGNDALGAMDTAADADLAAYAVNRLPYYEAAVDALESLVAALEYEPGSMLGGKIALAYGALARLRKDTADVR